MCSRHRPENGADSEAAEPAEPAMQEPVRPTREQITAILRNMMPKADEDVLLREVAKAEMADALGRAIHQAKRVGGPWGPACMRVKPGAEHGVSVDVLNPDYFEQVPYRYEGGEYECECESMAVHLVELMQRASVAEEEASRIVVPGHGSH